VTILDDVNVFQAIGRPLRPRPFLLGLPVANRQKTTLSRGPARAQLDTAETLAYLEGVPALRVGVLVSAR
jgi:hypothetical protein